MPTRGALRMANACGHAGYRQGHGGLRAFGHAERGARAVAGTDRATVCGRGPGLGWFRCDRGSKCAVQPVCACNECSPDLGSRSRCSQAGGRVRGGARRRTVLKPIPYVLSVVSSTNPCILQPVRVMQNATYRMQERVMQNTRSCVFLFFVLLRASCILHTLALCFSSCVRYCIPFYA